MTQNYKMILTPYLWNCSSYDCGFWYICVNWWYLQQFFFSFFSSFFQNYDFSGFSKFINKCQKEILKCVPPSLFNCYFANPLTLTRGHGLGYSFTYLMLITAFFFHIWLVVYWEPFYKVESINLTECSIKFELVTFQFQF